MGYEDERGLREEVERDRVLDAGFRAAGFLAAGFLAAAGFFAADDRVPDDARDDVDLLADDAREAAGFAAEDVRARGVVVRLRERDAVERDAAVVPDGFAAPPLPSSEVTRLARFSISPRRPRSSSSRPRDSSSWRTRATAFATSSTSSRPLSFEPEGSARSTALRIASTVSAASEPFLVSFFFLSFLAMARV
jgi:hypothetical protein